jgi:flagellar biosynthesis GTPase FlhF
MGMPHRVCEPILTKAYVCFQAQQEALQSTLKAVEQELEQTRASLAETKRAFESAREEWQADKKTLEDTIVDMTTAEKNLAEDRLSRESDVQAHEERVRVGAPSGCPISSTYCHCNRRQRRDIRVRSLHMPTQSRSSRISSSVFTSFKSPNGTTGRWQRPHKLNWLALKAVGISKGKHLTGKSPILPRGTIFYIYSLWTMTSDRPLPIS